MDELLQSIINRKARGEQINYMKSTESLSNHINMINEQINIITMTKSEDIGKKKN